MNDETDLYPKVPGEGQPLRLAMDRQLGRMAAADRILQAAKRARYRKANPTAAPEVDDPALTTAIQSLRAAKARQHPDRVKAKVGRNDPCLCNSGLKRKRCCQ